MWFHPFYYYFSFSYSTNKVYLLEYTVSKYQWITVDHCFVTMIGFLSDMTLTFTTIPVYFLSICEIYIYNWGSLCFWSYGSWIYNYLCSQCLSPPMLWVRISIRASCTTLCDKVCQGLVTGQWFSLFPSPIELIPMI
jgi:hypothetical protein